MFDQSFHRFDGPMQDGPVVYALSNYAKFFSDIFYWQVLGRTLAIAMVVATVSVVLAYPLAYTLARSKSRWKLLIVVVVMLPLITNLVVRNYGWLVILSENGLLNAALEAVGIAPFTLIKIDAANLQQGIVERRQLKAALEDAVFVRP